MADQYYTSTFLPVKKNLQTKELSWAVPSLLGDMYSAYTAPSRALQGQLDPNTLQGLLEANNFALNLMGGGAATGIGKKAEAGVLGVNLPHTPSKPNPLVGTRFESEQLGNLVPERKINPEELLGSSIKIKPYDLTSADVKVSSVSDEKLNNPVTTMGGFDFSRLPFNYENQIGGASNKEIAKRILGRTEQTRKENIASQGTGQVFQVPITMGQNSEFFSTYPTDILKQLVMQNGDKKSVAQLNEWLRNAPVQTQKGIVRPFGEFKGIETPEGQQQLLTGEGFASKGTAGEFRKAFATEMSKTRNEKAFGYNFEDVRNSVLDPRLLNVPKGYGGLTVVKSIPNAPLTPSAIGSRIGAYDTDIGGTYFGNLGLNPIEVLQPKTYKTWYDYFKKCTQMHIQKNCVTTQLEQLKNVKKILVNWLMKIGLKIITDSNKKAY